VRNRTASCTIVDVTLLGIAGMVTMLAAHTAADADLWGHLRFGADAMAGGRLPVHDPYSFTSDIAWINHEWLSETIFAATYAVGGAAALNSLKLAIVAAVAALVWRCLRRAGATTFSCVLATSLVVLATATRTGPVRPQLFSVIAFAALMTILDAIERGHTRGHLAIAALFCLWANVHGGWIVGLGALAVGAACARRPWPIAVGLVATLANPYGLGLWRFVYDTVGLSRPEIVDWMPLYRLPPAVVAVECAIPILGAIAVARTRRIPAVPQLAIVALLAMATVRVSRIDAFLQLAIVFACAPAIAETLNGIESRLRRSPRLCRVSAVHAASAAAIAFVSLAYVASHITRITVEGDWMPDAEAMRYIRAHVRDARLVTWFDWGEYAIWHLSPNRVVVSMDGRRETVYSDRVLRDHFAFYRNDGDEAWRYPDRIGADRVWLPTKLPVVATLRAHGWHVEFETATSALLSRHPSPPASAVPHDTDLPATFPGP
jgi:hypothetical protein